MENKITYPNEFTYSPPEYKSDVSEYWHVAERNKTKMLLEYQEEYFEKVKKLKLYILNNILGNVYIYVNAEHICVEVNSSHGTSEGFRKKLIGKHITEIKEIFANINEYNVHSAQFCNLNDLLRAYNMRVSQSRTYYDQAKRNNHSKEHLSTIEATIKSLDSQIEETKKLIEAEKEIEFPKISS
jgi:hypothetical protein